MVRHTLKSLGPKVLASRMVSEYVRRLYAPAAASSKRMLADDFAAAKQLAAWRTGVVASWPAVSVLHVESQLSGTGDAQLGETLTLRAEVALGGLSPDDVVVEAVFGAVDAEDRLTDVETVAAARRRAGRRRQPVRGRGPAAPHRRVRLHRPGAAPQRAARLAAELGVVATA